MAFSFITAAATGTFQTLMNRLIQSPTTISLSDTPGALSTKSIPFDGSDDRISFPNPILLENMGAGSTGGLSASNFAFDCWMKLNASSNPRNTFWDSSIIRSSCATSSGFDGIYNLHVITTGGAQYIDFRIDHANTYTLTSMSIIPTLTWTHVMCVFNSGAQTMQIWINGALNRQGTLGSASVVTGAPIGATTHYFLGRLDEMRLWMMSGAASSINRLASISSIGLVPEDPSISLNEFSPSANTMLGWWRMDSTSAVQLFSSLGNSIVDYTAYALHGTPLGFAGSDTISLETTIVQGLSASGDLRVFGGGDQDHGGLICLDPQDGTIVVEAGAQNLINNGRMVWSTTGTGVVVTDETNTIFYGTSAVKVKTVTQDTGVYIDISNSAVLFEKNTYTCGFRIRSISGSTSARLSFILGASAATITATMNIDEWKPIVLSNILSGSAGSSLTGRVQISQLNYGVDAGSLFYLDGLQIIEGDFPAALIAEGRIRKSGQVTWEVTK